jgi:hypothetical protein
MAIGPKPVADDLRNKRQGAIINSDRSQPATSNDPCMERGVTVAYNAEATNAARKDVVEFLSKLFQNQAKCGE